MKIDIHAHAFPESFVKEYKPLVESGLVPSIDLDFRPWNVDEHLALLEEVGIDLQVLSLVLTAYVPDRDAMRGIIQAGNDGIAEVCRRFPEKFAALAALPLVSVDDSVQEVRRAVDQLGMRGVILGSNVRGEPIDGEKYHPLFEELNGRKLPILFHPIDPMGPERYNEFQLDLWVGWPAETTFAISRLILNGVLDRFPDMRLILSHLGGSTHYLLERIGEAARFGRMERPFLEYYKAMYYETAGPVPSAAVYCAHSLFGPARILLGTDYPFGPEEGRDFARKAISCVTQLSLPEEDEESIFSGNARELLGL
ncbi:MAG: amidohydrolase family protein [Nitrospinota bacterium]